MKEKEMGIEVGDILKLKTGEVVKVTEVRNNSFQYPIWYKNIETLIPNGCQYKDIEN